MAFSSATVTKTKRTDMPTPSKTSDPSIQNFKAPQVSVVFMGTPEFAATTLASLIAERYNIVGVVTQPDRKSGRKQELTPSAVKALAMKHGLPVFQPERLDKDAIKKLSDWKPDIIVVAAYGRILPKAVLDLPGFGCINVHASILPRWRGASPVANALIAGDTETGITIMELNEGMDTGDIIAVKKLPINPEERANELLDRLAELGAALLIETLPFWITRAITTLPQTEDGVTLCQLIEREDGRIFWNASATEIYNRFRGLHPWPGLFTYWRRDEDGAIRIKLHEIEIQKSLLATQHPVGTVLEIGEKIGIVTGAGVIFPVIIQAEGKAPLTITEFLQGYPDFIGAILI